jgi:type VI secretion system FHA domain protein
MTLTLEVIGPQAARLGPAHRKVFTVDGGTIGRLPDNDWVLPDPYISSHHARIRCKGNAFYIEDTSTNGVFINQNRLAKNQPQALAQGDCISIEPYEIRASIAEDAVIARGIDDPFHVDDPFGAPPAPAREPIVPPSSHILDEPMSAGAVDPMSLLGFDGGAPSSVHVHVPRADSLAAGSLLAEPYVAPAVQLPPASAPSAPPGAIPDDYDPLLSDSQLLPRAPAAPAAPAPVIPAAPRAATPPPPARTTPPARRAPAPPADAQDVMLSAVLRHAGIRDVTTTPELARSFGQILRIVVTGVMDVLQARQRIKEEFRMRTTTFKPKENNPLKFSANVDDALHNLLVKRNPAYFEPVRAFEDAFDDVRNHQMAMLAGVRAAFEAMLAEFDPDRLQEEFERQPRKGALISMPAKMRYWEMYREKVHGIVKDADTSFRELFGDEFARAYEEQLERLKGRDRGQSR